MANGVITATETHWGYAVSVSAGTGTVTTTMVPKDKYLKVTGIALVGAATTDIYTVNDADGNMLMKLSAAAGTSVSTVYSIGGAKGVRMNGLQIVFGGASSTGLMSIFTDQG